MKSINLNHLEAFCILSDTLNFSQTAEMLQTSQPAISLKIKLLEENLGYELFIRDKKNISLSQKGMELKDKIYQSYQNLVSVSTEELQEFPLKVGSIYEAGERILAPVLSKLAAKKTISGFHLTLKSTDELMERLLSGELDFILIHQLPVNKSIHAVAIYDDRPILIGHPKSQLKDLDSLPSLPFATYRSNDLYTENFIKGHLTKNQIKKVTKNISINSHRSMVKIVSSLYYFAVIPFSSLSKTSKDKVKILIEDKRNYSLYICTRSNFLSNRDNEKILGAIIKEITLGKKSE